MLLANRKTHVTQGNRGAIQIAAVTAVTAMCALPFGCQNTPDGEGAIAAPPRPSPPATSGAPAPPAPPVGTCTPMMRGRIGIDKSHGRLEPFRRLRDQGVPMMGCVDGGAPSTGTGTVVVDSGAPPLAVGDDAQAPLGDDAGSTPLDDAGALTLDDAEADSAPPVPPPPPLDAGSGGDGGPELDWNFATTGPVNASVAIVTPSYPNANPTLDAIYFGAVSGSPNFFGLGNIYNTTPSVTWSATTGGLFGTAVALSADSTEVFAVDQTGALFCFAAANGAICPGWTTQSVKPGVSAVQWSSPWLDYGSNNLYYGDSSGALFKVNALTGAKVWSYALSTSAIESDPIFTGGYVYLGDTLGNIYRVLDPGTTAPTAADVSSYSDCSPSCTAFSPIETGPTADLGTGQIFFAGNGKIFQFTVGAGTWTPTATVSLNMPPGLNYSSPAVDGAGTLYVGFYGGVFETPYPLTGSPPVGAFLYGQGNPSTTPRSGPTVYNGSVYIGDSAGMAEQYSCLTTTNAPALDAVTSVYGSTVDSTPLVDYVNGNVVFGYSTAGGAGGLVQITQAGGWGCGSEAPCATGGCGGTVCAPAMGCVPESVPPPTTWLSGGGGTSALSGGDSVALSIGGLCTGGIATTGGGATVWFGALANETF